MPSEPNQSLMDYIMNIRSRLLTRERFFADDRSCCRQRKDEGIREFCSGFPFRSLSLRLSIRHFTPALHCWTFSVGILMPLQPALRESA